MYWVPDPLAPAASAEPGATYQASARTTPLLPAAGLESVRACWKAVISAFHSPIHRGRSSATLSSSSVQRSPSVRITRPFHLLASLACTSDSRPYRSTCRACRAVAEYATARPTWWAVLTGAPAATMGPASSGGSSLETVAAGATLLMVAPHSCWTAGRSARTRPTTYARGSVSSGRGKSKQKDKLTASLTAL